MRQQRELRHLAAILPRYGANLGGGAETLLREVLLQLHHRRNLDPASAPTLSGIERIEVWSTCAKDHRTWENSHPPGTTSEDGFPVLRFPVDQRDLETFIGRELDIAGGRVLHPTEQLDWLAAGVNSKALYKHLAKEGKSFDALLFGPYLFPTTFWGGLIHPDKTLLLPCLHDEAYAYQAVFGVLFRGARGVICNAPAEARLVADIYGQAEMEEKTTVVGLGFVPPRPIEIEKRPYLLYSGRKEEGKNLHRLIEWFVPLHRRYPELELVLMGSGEITFLKELPPGVSDRGFVSDEEKRRLMAGALLLCQPSVNESFSIVLMEAWLERTPVLVHADCPVTREHVVASQGGLMFSNAEELFAAVERVYTDRDLARRLADRGFCYVRDEYSWTAVLGRLESAFAKAGYVPCGSSAGSGAAREPVRPGAVAGGAV